MSSEQVCTKCFKLKDLSHYSPTKRKYNGMVYDYLRSDCKECRQVQKREWNKNNKDKIKKYNDAHYKKYKIDRLIKRQDEKQQTI